MPELATVVLVLMLALVVLGLLAALAMFMHGLRARNAARRYARLAPPPKAGRQVGPTRRSPAAGGKAPGSAEAAPE